MPRLRGARLLLILIALPGPALVRAQSANGPDSSLPGSIQGTVTFLDQGEPEPLPGVTVRLSPATEASPSLSTTTNSEGVYQLAALPENTYALEVSLNGFQSQTGTAQLTNGALIVRNFSLRIAASIQTAEVREETGPITAESASTTSTVTSKQIADVPMAQRTVYSTLPMVPGVIRTSDGTLNMKGASENQGMLLVDSAETVDPVTGSFSIPISADAVQSMSVLDAPYNADYGGFSGGLTEIHTKPPSDRWQLALNELLPGFRGKNGVLVGIQDEEPRLYLTGPLRKGKLNFSEAVTYTFMRPPVRGLAWPYNETITQGAGALTNIEAILSPRHLLHVNLNVFFQGVRFANINALVPQTASSNDGDRGFTVGATDSYQFVSGIVMSTVFKYTRLDSDAHGQGPADMVITPDGWGGNFFNSWNRSSNQFQVLPSMQLPLKSWHGRHELKEGVSLTRRSYDGNAQSHPIQLLREDGSLAEQINFFGAGRTHGIDTEIAEFLQDHWTMSDRLSVDLDARMVSATSGKGDAFAPRAGMAYQLGKNQKTMIQAGAGVFYDRVPLLATDFTNNLTRVISYYDASGQLMGSPTSLQNVYLQQTSGSGFALANSDMDMAARNFTWNVELDRELRRNIQFRVSFLQSSTRNLPVVMPLPGVQGGPSLLGLAYAGSSPVDVLQNYVGTPNASRFPLFFSLDAQVYREVELASLPFLGRFKGRTVRIGLFSLDLTNHQNPHDVFSDIASPSFGRFTGFARRVDGFVFELH
jgi:Carboxypeptidase regulatory-like domain/TonB-dependent Receptor Plug Domain